MKGPESFAPQEPQADSDQERADAIQRLIDDEVRQGEVEVEAESNRRVETSVMHASAQAVKETLQKRLGEAMVLADSPESVEMILVNSAVDLARTKLRIKKDFAAGTVLNDLRDTPGQAPSAEEQETWNERRSTLDQLRTDIDAEIRNAVLAELRHRLEAELQVSELPREIDKFTKMINAVEQAQDKAA